LVASLAFAGAVWAASLEGVDALQRRDLQQDGKLLQKGSNLKPRHVLWP